MKKFLFNKVWIRILQIFLGILFIYSGILKILNLFEFSLTVAKYGILPEKLINLFSTLLPFFELISGFFLLSGFFIQGASLIISFMLSIFTIAIIFVISKGASFECGCFEIFGKEPKTGIFLVIRNFFLLAFSLNVFFYGIKNKDCL